MPKIYADRKAQIDKITKAIEVCADKAELKRLKAQLTYHSHPKIESRVKRRIRINQQINKYKALLTQENITEKQKSHYETRLQLQESLLVIYE